MKIEKIDDQIKKKNVISVILKPSFYLVLKTIIVHIAKVFTHIISVKIVKILTL